MRLRLRTSRGQGSLLLCRTEVSQHELHYYRFVMYFRFIRYKRDGSLQMKAIEEFVKLQICELLGNQWLFAKSLIYKLYIYV